MKTQKGKKQSKQTSASISANAFLAEDMMIRWALGFFVIALIAALLGFGGIAVAAAGIAKIIFYIFLVLFVISLIGHLASRT
jgi:uncharacterized membrane protein YtjA (UPF0391 family)